MAAEDKEPKETVEPEPKREDEDVVIDLDDAEDEGPVEAQGEEPRLTRDQKKSGRWREHTERTQEAERRAEEAQRELAAERARAAAYEAQLRQPPPQYQQPQPPPDPVRQEFDRISREQQALVREYNSLPDSEKNQRFNEYNEKLHGLKAQEFELNRRAAPNPQVMMQNMMRQMRENEMRTRYGDVVNNQVTLTHADGLWRQKIAAKAAANPGVPWSTFDTQDLWEEVIADTRRAFGMKTQQRSPVDNGLKERTSGVSRGASGGSNGGGRQVKMTKERRQMARRAFPHLPEEQAFKQWALTAGKELIENGEA